MKSETIAYLAKARTNLMKAEHNLKFPDEAGRLAYLAAFSSAQALIFETRGKVAKTHKGLRSEFARIVMADRANSSEFTRFLGQGYEVKMIADYEILSRKISRGEAEQAIATAKRFIEYVEKLIAGGEQG